MTLSRQPDDRKVFAPMSTLRGSVRVPGDKSLTHRAILFGLLADGTTRIIGHLDADDCRSSRHVAELLGAQIREQHGVLEVTGTAGQLHEPADVLDCGNSGTTMRLFMGAVAARVPFACFTGDASLRNRPMSRVITPLTAMGAEFRARARQFAPLCCTGGPLRGIEYALPVPSAQVKSAVLIAGALAASGHTVIHEPVLTRDHTENLMTAFGVEVARRTSDAGQVIEIAAGQRFRAATIHIPGDISSAAFLLAAGALVPNSEITVRGVGLNPTRTGFLEVIREMGADVQVTSLRTESGELIGDVTVRHAPLRGITITADRVPRLIDELPIFAVMAAMAAGDSIVQGAGELRIKETDRIKAVVHGLRQLGIEAVERPDGFMVCGAGRIRGGVVDSHGDHRIAMSFAIAGLCAAEPVTVEGWTCVSISFPSFLDVLQQLGPDGHKHM